LGNSFKGLFATEFMNHIPPPFPSNSQHLTRNNISWNATVVTTQLFISQIIYLFH